MLVAVVAAAADVVAAVCGVVSGDGQSLTMQYTNLSTKTKDRCTQDTMSIVLELPCVRLSCLQMIYAWIDKWQKFRGCLED